MAATALPIGSRPKRKRAQVSYYEGSSDESDVDDCSSSIEYSLSRKKPKTTTKAASSKPLPKRKIFPFNSLPAELKNAIYTYALTDPNGVFLVSKFKRYRRIVKRDVFNATNCPHYIRCRYIQPQPGSDSGSDLSSITLPILVPNLLALDRQIYSEAQRILYGSNDFILEDTTALHHFLANIGSRNAAVLVDVTIKGWGSSKAHKALNHPAFTLLASAVNLRRLHLDCRISWYSSPTRVAMQVYRDTFHWLEAVGSAKGRWDAALQVIEVLEDNFSGSTYRPVSVQTETSHEEQMEVFRNELRKLLR